jgi:hypothetical protein
MKHWYVHLIYLSIIVFLGYNYWSSVQAFKAFEHLDRQLKADYDILEFSSSQTRQKLDRILGAYPNPIARHYADVVENNANAANDANNFIAFIKSEFLKANGNIDTAQNGSLMNWNPIKASKLFFTDTKINQIRDTLIQVSKRQIDSISHKKTKDELLKFLHLHNLIADNTFWLGLKKLPVNGVLAELSAVQNMIKTDEITMLNYYLNMNSFCGSFDEFKTAIAPKQAALIEGETFEAEVYIASYSKNIGNNVVIKVNGEPLEIKQGVAHFKSKNQTVGTKTIKAEAIIKNPLTGQTKTTEGYFEYQVLPKCSRDCQFIK